MRTGRLLLLALLFTGLFMGLFAGSGTASAQVSTAQRAPATINGTVVVAESSETPVADATVTLYAGTLPGGRTETQTDAAGAFGFGDLVAGNYPAEPYDCGI